MESPKRLSLSFFRVGVPSQTDRQTGTPECNRIIEPPSPPKGVSGATHPVSPSLEETDAGVFQLLLCISSLPKTCQAVVVLLALFALAEDENSIKPTVRLQNPIQNDDYPSPAAPLWTTDPAFELGASPLPASPGHLETLGEVYPPAHPKCLHHPVFWGILLPP